MELTFRKGGIHPDDKKYLSKSSELKSIPIPKELTVALSQHLGAPALPLKNVGDRVLMGEKIAQAAGFISANIHSPVSGVVKEIKKVVLANSVVCDAIVIIPDEQQPVMFTERIDYTGFTAEQLVSIVQDKGIVGNGGATFPSNVKLGIPKDKTVDALIVNGVECEPYLTSDYRLMLEKTDQFLEGVMICSKMVSPKRICLGIEANKPDAIELLSKRVKELGYPIEVLTLKMKYPQGDEKQLLKAILDREIPSGKLPLDVGGVVINAGTVLAIFNAVVYGKPLFERIVTVSGECVNNPGNFIASIGTPAEDLIEAAGGLKEEPDKYISGGPMMGFAFYDVKTPITKGTSGIIAIKDEKDYNQTPCLSCGKCVAACPIGLEPTRMYAYITNGRYADAMKLHLMDCKECGSCNYSCPAHLNLVQAFKYGKKMGKKK